MSNRPKVLITGASRGVGADASRFFAEKGFDVAINYRSKVRRAEAVAETVSAAGGSSLLVEADVTSEESVRAMFEKVQQEWGGLDVLVLNASGGLEKDAPEGYGMMLNRDSQVRMAKLAMPVLKESGRIVFVTSHLAHFFGEKPGVPEYDIVAESKHAGEVELRKLIPELNAQGLSLVVVSGDLLDGSITPRLLDRARPGVIESRRAEAGVLPTVADFAAAVVDAAINSDLASGETVYVGSTDWTAEGFNS